MESLLSGDAVNDSEVTSQFPEVRGFYGNGPSREYN